MFRLKGYHSYWSKPRLAQGHRLSVSDYELLTMGLSVAQFRKLGYKMTLVTDSIGAQFYEQLGVTCLYDEVLTDLDKVAGVDPNIFWAAGKLYAYELMPTPSISIDLDAVVWGIPDGLDEHVYDVGVLHEDFSDWDCYHSSKELYGDLGFKSGSWDWDVIPYNVGVLWFNNDMLVSMYVSLSQAFMENYTRFYTREMMTKRSRGLVKKGRRARVFEQIFAEQQLLSMVADRAGARVYKFTEIDKSIDYIKPNKYVSHLWSMKSVYRSVPEIKDVVVAGLLNKLGKEYKDTENLVGCVERAYSKNGRIIDGDAMEGQFRFKDMVTSTGHSGSDSGIVRVLDVSDVRGEIKAIEPCFGFERNVREGSKIVMGETLLLGEGSSCKISNGRTTLSVTPKGRRCDEKGYAVLRVVRGETVP